MDDELDGCDIDYADYAVSDEEVEYLPLFPDGNADQNKASEWKELFGE